MKVLVAGWFSFEQMGASAGDLLSRDVVCQWVADAGKRCDIALAAPFEGGVRWEDLDSRDYSHVVFVCGPFGNGPPVVEFLERFKTCRLIGANLTMLQSLDDWNPFELLIERDSSREIRPDLCFLSPNRRVPVVGPVLIDSQPEYKSRDMRIAANDALIDLTRSREMAVVRIDTRLDHNSTGLRTPAEIESPIAPTC